MFIFGNFGKKRSREITSLKDERLLLIDPSQNGFFDNVLNYSSNFEEIENFINSVYDVKKAHLPRFWKPIYDPSFDGENIFFLKDKSVAVGRSLIWWKNTAKKIPTVHGKKWSIGTDKQYIAFMVWLINKLVDYGWSVQTSIEAVVLDSIDLGIYCNSRSELISPDITGTFMICGCFDLGAHFKLLISTSGGYCRAGGAFSEHSYRFPLARIRHIDSTEGSSIFDTAWYVLNDN